MNKEELVDQVATDTGSNEEAGDGGGGCGVCQHRARAAARGESYGGRVRDVSSEVRAARDGRNPKTGDKIRIPSKKVPAFTAGKDLKAEVN